MNSNNDFVYYGYNQNVSNNEFPCQSLYHQSISPQNYYVPMSQSYHVNYSSYQNSTTPMTTSSPYMYSSFPTTASSSAQYDYNSYNSFNSSGYYSDATNFIQESPSLYQTEYTTNQVHPVSYSTSNKQVKQDTNNQSPFYIDESNSGPLRESKPGRNLLKEIDNELDLMIDNDDSQKRRGRVAFSSEQRRYLLNIFEQTKYPTKDILETTSLKLNVPTSSIQTWFKNTRSKQKKLTHSKNF